MFSSSLLVLSLIHISEPTRLLSISYAVFCLKKTKKYEQATPHCRSLGWGTDGDLVYFFLVIWCVPDDLRKLLLIFLQKPEEDRLKHANTLPETILLDIDGKTK